MRGCDNMCSFCVVPFTRGRERSRDLYSILAEVKDLEQNDYKEITLLGQNVDSYKWENPENKEVVNFATLLRFVAESAPKVRIRFSTSHPKDITNEVLETIASYNNICKYVHLPVQSGNSRILKMMNRTYDSVWYKERVDAIRRIIPECAISSDIIVGFCSETEEEFQDTLDMVRYSNYTLCYMYHYSERPGTLAAKKYPDDISDEIKQRRLSETIVVQRQNSYENNLLDVGKTFEVLIEGDSKKSNQQFAGRNSQNKVIVFRKSGDYKPGDFVMVKVTEVTSGTLLGKLIL
jgi:tRNA-2-methylthio-N6-dimethylallyladenosine synthase